jgi:O-antigen/teichoic acid export membrane protein
MSDSGLRRFVGGSAIYAMGGALGRAATLVVVPVYLRHLTADAYGLQSLALITEQVVVIIAAYAITNAVGRFYADVPRDSPAEAEIVATALASLMLCVGAAVVLLQLTAPVLAQWTLESSPRGVFLMRCIGVSFAGSALLSLLQAILLLRRRPWAYVAVSGGVQTAAALCSLAGLLWYPTGVEGLVAGYALATGSGGLGAAAWLAVRYRRPPSRRIALALVRYGLPLVPAALLMLVTTSVDRYVVRGWLGLSALGVYSAAYLVASAANLVFVTPFRLTWNSLIWNIRRREDEALTHQRLFARYVVVQATIIGLLIVGADLALSWLSGHRTLYVAAWPVVPCIYVGFVCLGAADVLSVGYFFESRTSYHLVVVAAAAASSVLLNLILVRPFGYAGSGIAYATSFLLFAVLASHFGRRFFDAGHAWQSIAVRAVLVLAVACAVRAWIGVAPAVGVTIASSTLVVLSGLVCLLTLRGKGSPPAVAVPPAF